MNARKAAGPEGIPECVQKACAEQLANVFPDILNLFLAQAVVPISFKAASIVLVPKHPIATALNDIRPVTLSVLRWKKLLLAYHWEHTHKLHLSMVWQLLCIRPQNTQAGIIYWHSVTFHWEYLSQWTLGQRELHHQGCHPPETCTFLTASIWQAFLKPPLPLQQA